MRKIEIESLNVEDYPYQEPLPVLHLETLHLITADLLDSERVRLINENEHLLVINTMRESEHQKDLLAYAGRKLSAFNQFKEILQNERKEDMKSRWLALNDQAYLLHLIGHATPNHYDKLEEVLESDDIDLLTTLEMANSSNLEKQAKEKIIQEKRAKGLHATNCCNGVLAIINGFNQDRELTYNQITQMKSTFSLIKELLKDGQPKTAKIEILKITPDGVLINQDLLDAVIHEFEQYGY
jgi:hypothetical protein